MGYEMFRQAVKNMDSSSHPIRKWLIDPGPSVVIIDEGHKIKSNKSQLSSVVKLFDTKFRICMTGYPLQNNLDEYYCMIDFIYPGYLGTLPEFRNAYKNPIEYFYEDISPAERFISRRQLYKLQRTLADLIHRFVLLFVLNDTNGGLPQCVTNCYCSHIQTRYCYLAI